MVRKLIPEKGEHGYKKLMREARNRHSTIYFVEAVGLDLIKIGYAMDPWKRFHILLSAAPVPLKMLAMKPGGPVEESRLHQQFAAQRSHGEWFRRCPEFDALIAEHKTDDFGEALAGILKAPDPSTRAAVRAKLLREDALPVERALVDAIVPE